MTDITDRADAERVLRDPAFRVPEADAAATRPAERFRGQASRFVNGPLHDSRRERLEAMLDGISPEALATAAAARTRSMLPAGADELAAGVPVAALADLLRLDDPDAAPELVAVLAEHYPTGSWSSAAADDAAIRLLEAAATEGDDEPDGLAAALRVQLLVQAHAATATLIATASALPAAADPGVSTDALLAGVLRDTPPVRRTRRISPAGDLLVRHLDGPDRDAREGSPRTLAFGAGPRACPARDHAFAIAAAVVDEVRPC